MFKHVKSFAAVAALLVAPMAANAATVTVGPGTFDDGWATAITYDDSVSRSPADNRDNPLNALGPADDKFFTIGLGSWAEFTFGTLFNSDTTVWEVTFGNVANYLETADVFAGLGGTFKFVDSIENNEAQSGVTLSLANLGGPFDTIRLVDTSANPPSLDGFDVDAVRVTPVPLPAAAWLFGSALVGAGIIGRRKKQAAAAA